LLDPSVFLLEPIMDKTEWFAALDRCAKALDISPMRLAVAYRAAERLRLEGISPWAAASELWPAADELARAA
jgi:hypothetical protein